MDLNNNPQEETFLVTVTQQYAEKFKDIPLDILVFDSNHHKYVISTCDTPKKNQIISLLYNSNPNLSPSDTQYFITTPQELYDTLNFIHDNFDTFVTTATDDVYDNFEIVSLEEDEH